MSIVILQFNVYLTVFVIKVKTAIYCLTNVYLPVFL